MTGPTGPLHRLRTLPLRSRLALLVATAVAVAVAVAAVACWLLTRTQLESELDNSIRNTSAGDPAVRDALNNCGAPISPENRAASPMSRWS